MDSRETLRGLISAEVKSIARNKGFNFIHQEYKGIFIQLIDRIYGDTKAKRYVLKPRGNGQSNQNVWIPNKHLLEDGTVKENENIDYVFRGAQRQLELAGYLGAIPGIKRRTQQ